MNVTEAIRLSALAQAVIDAKEWRETFEDANNHDNKYDIAHFEDVSLRDKVRNATSSGFEGSLMMPRDIAIEMMKWLEDRASSELKKSR